jgi:hypothetical protein
MRLQAIALVKREVLLLVFALFSMSRALATVPPDYFELTSTELTNRKFKFDIQRIDTQSSIDLDFPEQVFVNGFWLVPSSTYVVVKNKDGKVIAWTINYIKGSAPKSIVTSYDHDVSDVSVSVTYKCEHATGCFGAATFGISSISKFIEANPDADGLQPKCHKFTGEMVEIVNCKEVKKK